MTEPRLTDRAEADIGEQFRAWAEAIESRELLSTMGSGTFALA